MILIFEYNTEASYKMEEFDISHLEDYSIEQLASFIIAGKTTVQELYDEGLFRPLRNKLLKELEVRDNIAWKDAVANGTIEAITGYIDAFDQPAPHYHGSHVEEAKSLRTQIEQTADTSDSEPYEADPLGATGDLNGEKNETPDASSENGQTTNNEDSADSNDDDLDSSEPDTIHEVNPDISESKMEKAGDDKSSTGNGKMPITTKISIKGLKKWGLISLTAVVAGIIIYVVLHSLNKKEEVLPLTQDEIAEIIKNYQDSHKTDIFDGFYLIPAAWDGIPRNYPMPLPGEEGFDENLRHPTSTATDNIHADTPQDVLALFKGRLNVVNKEGSIMPLPGVSNGIDSLLVISKPFIEYIDDNGLRRVVALLNKDLYYYAGYCGTHDGFRQYILINRSGKYGLVDENGTIIKDFFNEEIVTSSSNYYIKNGSAKQYYDSVGNALKENTAVSIQNSNTLNVDYTHDNFTDQTGKVIASFEEITFSNYKGRYKVKGAGGYGIYNANQRKIEVPLRYEDISVYGVDTDLFPAKKNGKWGFVRSGGTEILEFRYKATYSFDPDTKLACVKEDGGDNKCGYIDMSGSYKIQPQYYSAGTLTPDGARVMRSSTEYGYISKSGSLITSWYPYMGKKFVLDRIFVRNNEKLGGFIDKNNKLVIPYQFEETDTDPIFSEVTHLAKVRFKGMDWYINTNGAFSIPKCIYVDALDKRPNKGRADEPNRKGDTRKKRAKDVAPTEQSIPELMLKITESSEHSSQEIANEENDNKPKAKQQK